MRPFSMDKGFAKYFANTSWLMSGNLLRLIMGLLVGVVVARYLGPSEYGKLNYAMAYVAIFSAFANLGLDSIVVRELVRYPDQREEYLGTAASLRLLGTVAMVSLLLLASILMGNSGQYNALIAIIAFGYFFQISAVIDWLLQARVESKYTVKIQILSMLTTSVLQLVAVWLHASLIYFAIISTAGSAMMAIGLLWIYRERFGDLEKWKFRHEVARKFLLGAFPLMLSGFSIMIYMRIDQVMLQRFLGSEAVGLYSVAVKLAESWYFVPMLITTSLYPAIINAKKNSEDEYKNRLQRLHNLLVLISIIVAVVTTLVSHPIIAFLYGSEYIAAAPVLNIYIWSGLFVGLGAASSRFLLVEEMHWRDFFRTFSGMVINVLLNIVLIPDYGIEGAAFATLVSYAFAGYAYDLLDGRCREMFMVKTRSLFFFWRLAS